MSSDAPVLLLVDDDDCVRDLVTRFAERGGYRVVSCANGREAMAQLRQTPADLALVDLRMPDIDGIEVLRAIRDTVPTCEVVLMTGFGTIANAVEAIRLGARDYLSKPFDFERLNGLLESVREEAERRRRLFAVESGVAPQLSFQGMLGRSAVMQQTFSLIRRFAPHVRTVLITGETGTGKELAARGLHEQGPRQARRFVAVNCSAVVDTLFESELFGHVKGAFTGAVDHKPGLFEAADGGTLFLDEIGELPLAVQGKLLRVLEQGEGQRVGSLETRKVDVCVFAATNRDPREEVAAGRFRSDLFYRINVVELEMPTLRDRREDIPYLTAAFIREFADRLHKPLLGMTPAAERVLVSSEWPGNVRELRNAIERACILADGRFISERDLGGLCGSRPVAHSAGTVTPSLARSEPRLNAIDLAERERAHIERVLGDVGGNKKAAAARLGLSRRALYRRLERHSLNQSIARRPGRQSSYTVSVTPHTEPTSKAL
jgi:two-component system response regulator HydG